MRVRFLPYSMSSQSVKALSQALNAKRIKREGSAFKPRLNDLIINWGLKYIPDGYENCNWLNKPIREYRNKLAFYESCEEFVPPFTTNKDEAVKMLPVLCRTVLNGHSGEGIVIADQEDELMDAPVYCKYIKKMHEFRIHFFDREPFFVQQKKKRLDVEDVNYRIRSHNNGFIFAANEIEVPEVVPEVVTEFLYTCPLDFGAIDVIYNHKKQKAYILEVNMSPGLEGTTLEMYTNRIYRAIEVFRKGV